MKYERIKPLFGDDFAKLQNAKVLLLGVGGVGGHCLDCLCRSGVRHITIVDFDTYDASNQNRQLHSELHEGEVKVHALQKHYPHIQIINTKIDEAWVEAFDFSGYDVVLDAIDDIKPKLAVAQKCHKKLISSLGSAKRLDPTKVEVSDIWKSYGDKFGAKIRYELKKRGFNKKYKVIFSAEEAKTKEKASFMGVTATFGLVMCAEALGVLRRRKMDSLQTNPLMCEGIIGDGCGGGRIFYVENETLYALDPIAQESIVLLEGIQKAKKISKAKCTITIECEDETLLFDLSQMRP